MMKLILIVGLLLIAAPVMGATPTVVSPTPTPSITPTPTPVPADVPSGVIVWPYDISLRANFSELTTAAITDTKLINVRTGQSFTVPAHQRFYVTDVNWSLVSEVVAQLEFDGTYSDQLFDIMNAVFTGQGKVIHYSTPLTSLDPGCSPVLTTDRACTGWVYVGGYLQ